LPGNAGVSQAGLSRHAVCILIVQRHMRTCWLKLAQRGMRDQQQKDEGR
jgi:hypothetical protein